MDGNSILMQIEQLKQQELALTNMGDAWHEAEDEDMSLAFYGMAKVVGAKIDELEVRFLASVW